MTSGLLLVVTVILLGCAGSQSTIPSDLDQLGDAELRADILSMIALRELGAGGSGEPQVVGAREVHVQPGCGVQEWVIDRDGEVVYYPVLLVPDANPETGTTFAVMRPQDEPMDSAGAAQLVETMGALLRPN